MADFLPSYPTFQQNCLIIKCWTISTKYSWIFYIWLFQLWVAIICCLVAKLQIQNCYRKIPRSTSWTLHLLNKIQQQKTRIQYLYCRENSSNINGTSLGFFFPRNYSFLQMMTCASLTFANKKLHSAQMTSSCSFHQRCSSTLRFMFLLKKERNKQKTPSASIH